VLINGVGKGEKIGHTFHVFVRASASPRLEKAMKDLLPWKGCMKGRKDSILSNMRRRAGGERESGNTL